MKNFKLLLGATALLSMEAVVTNASDLDGMSDTITDFHVKAEIVNTLNLREEKALDFGRIAWDPAVADSGVSMSVGEDGIFEINYDGVTFHDGGHPGEICFTDLVTSATIGHGLYIEMGGDAGVVPVYAENETVTPIEGAAVALDFYTQATTPAKPGERCFYVSGDLNFTHDAKVAFPAGKILSEVVVTVIYDSVN